MPLTVNAAIQRPVRMTAMLAPRDCLPREEQNLIDIRAFLTARATVGRGLRSGNDPRKL
jgi:hypothetical protein